MLASTAGIDPLHVQGLVIREGADGCIGVSGAHEVVVGSAQELIGLLASATWAR